MMMTKTTAPITLKMIIFYQREKNKAQSVTTTMLKSKYRYNIIKIE